MASDLPGSPVWWVQRLLTKLLNRQERYDLLEDYIIGDHRPPNGDRRYMRALKEVQRKAKTNYCDLVLQATLGRIHAPVGFTFGEAASDKDARRMWMESDMDYQHPILMKDAGTFGLTYAMVSPPDEDGGMPIITMEDPRACIVEYDPVRPTRAIVGLKMWLDDIDGAVYIVLYTPDTIYLFRSGQAIINQLEDQLATLSRRLQTTSTASQISEVERFKNPLGRIPLIEGNWQPSHGPLGRAEHENIIDIQDRINQGVLDRLIISKFQAYHQRWMTGSKPSDGKKGRPQFEPGSDMVWVALDKGAKFGDFATADLTQALAAVRDDIGDLIAVSQTPATYLTNRMVNVSGSAMSLDQSALVAKAGMRLDAMSYFYMQVVRTGFLYLGDARAKEVESHPIWLDPEAHTMAELADAGTKYFAVGIPLALIMRRQKIWSEEEIQYAVAEKEKADKLAQQQADKALQMQKEQMQAQKDAAPQDMPMNTDQQGPPKDSVTPKGAAAKPNTPGGSK